MSPIRSQRKRYLPKGCAILLGAVCVAPSVFAQNQLGPFDNLLIKNPYDDALSGYFGRSVVAGDFDGDGVYDLAVSEPGGQNLRVMLGADRELGSSQPHFVPVTIDMPNHDHVMVSGDFDGDGRDEIAVGASGSATGAIPTAGSVYVIDRANNGTWSVLSEVRAGGAYPGTPQQFAFLGSSLAEGDFDDDGFADLAIGIIGQTVSGASSAGAVMVTYGSIFGITANGATIFNRNNDGLSFPPMPADRFGAALATGDFDGDDDDDLAIGIAGAICPNGTTAAGAVVVMNGSTNGVSNAESHIWRPGVQGVAGDCANTLQFGAALAVGDFDFDLHADIAIGAPSGLTTNDDAVHVLYGSDTGLSSTNDQRIAPPALPGGGSNGGYFGSALATGLLARDCPLPPFFCAGSSLVIGAPWATVDGVERAGAVWVIHAPIGGRLDIGTATPILPRAPLAIGAPHADDRFGNALAVGDFNDDRRADLAIGIVQYDDGVDTDAGAVQVLYQYETMFSDGFE